MDGRTLLEHYRLRAVSEKDFGDWNQAPDLSLSSSPRPKAHYRGEAIERPSLRSLLFELSPCDPPIFTTVTLFHCANGLLAA